MHHSSRTGRLNAHKIVIVILLTRWTVCTIPHFSFGQTAIFLIGGPTREETPAAIYLKSGDIVVMSKESRLCYHAVPKIMKTDVSWLNEPIENREPCCATDETDKAIEMDTRAGARKKRRLTSAGTEYCDAFADDIWNSVVDQVQWKSFGDYISDCRININVRQVLHAGEQSL